MQLPRNLKIRRILLTILGVVVLHVVVIYGFMSFKVKLNNNPRLVYTHIVANPNVSQVMAYVALPQAPCVALDKTATANAALPSCTEIRPPPAGHNLLGDHNFIGLHFIVDAKGRVQQTAIVDSSGAPALDQAALEQVRDTWVFAPCQIDQNQNCAHTIKFRWLP